ncbi:MAG TPA: hypothetical protein VGO84_15325, partial [Burkholderiales bacterium]|nr:hypothetical protein [Burkholderiales bacterium]
MQPSFRRHIGNADANRNAAGVLNFGETVFVGQVVADENRQAALKRRLSKERFDRGAFVMRSGLELDDHLAFLHGKIPPLLELREESQHIAGELRTFAKMDCERRAFVFQPDTIVSGGEGRDQRAHLVHE